MHTTLTLRAGDWIGEVRPDFSMNLTALSYKGIPLMRTPPSPEALQELPQMYGTPLLMPPNRTCAGQFTFDGKTYHLPINETAHNNHIHGHMLDASFTVVEQAADHVRAEFTDEAATRYPFPFRMVIEDRLNDSGYTRLMRVTNIGHTDMPLVLGFHTTFVAPDFFSVPLGRRWITDEHFIPTGERVSLEADQQIYCDGCCPKGLNTTGFYEMAGNTVVVGDFRYTAEGFDQWILFNGRGGSEYLCVEPQLGPVNGLNMPDGHLRLRPGESADFKITITHCACK